MGSTNRAKTGFVPEVTAGTTPASPAIQEWRNTSNGMVLKPTHTTSSEINADRQISDRILTKLEPTGSIGIEFSFNTHDVMIEAAFQGAWANNPSNAVTALSTTTATIASGGAAYKAQHLALMSGFATAANNNLFVVSSDTGTTVVFPSASFTAEASPPAAASVRVVGFQGASADITATATGLGSTSLDFTTMGLNAGQWVRVGGDAAAMHFATAACVGWARVAAAGIAAHALTFDILPTGWTTDAGTGKTIQVFFGDFLTNGTTQRAFSIERQQQDLTSPVYEYFTGQQADTMSLPLKSGAVVTGSFGFVGIGGSAGTVRASGASDLSPSTYPVMNAASNVGTLILNGAPVSGPSYITALGFDLKNGLAGQPAIGTLYNTGVRDGECDISGTLSAYFGDSVLLGLGLADTETSLQFRIGRKDNNRESLLIDVPAVKIEGTAPVTGKSADRMFNGTYLAKKHGSLRITASAGRYWYLPAVAA